MGVLTALAEEILANAKRLDAYVDAHNLKSPSFDDDSLTNLDPELESTRKTLINRTQTLKDLSQGTVGRTVEIAFSWTSLLSLRITYSFKLAHAVPLEGSTTYGAIASKTTLPEFQVRRFLRHAMGNHFFAEASPDSVRHTAVSRIMVTDPDFFDGIGLFVDEIAPTANNVPAALRLYGDSAEPNHTAFQIQNQTTLPIFEYLGQFHPERVRRFGAGMRFFTKGESWNLKYLLMGFDWTSIDKPNAVVFDVGGGLGSVSQYLAKATKHLEFIVQDLPSVVEEGRASLPEELRGRVRFMVQDFFKEQTIGTPDVYLFRWILHNWSDEHCVRILRTLVPTMRSRLRIVLYEYILDDAPQTLLTEKVISDTDMIMATCFNGAERTRAELIRLIKEADERFCVHQISRPEGSAVSIIELWWDSGENEGLKDSKVQ